MTPEPEESKTDPAQQQQQQLQGLAAVPKPVVPIPVAEVKVDLPSASEIAASLNLNESDDPMNAQILVLEAQQKEICSKAESLLDEVNNKSRMMSLGKAWEFDPKSFSYWFLLNPQKPMVDLGACRHCIGQITRNWGIKEGVAACGERGEAND